MAVLLHGTFTASPADDNTPPEEEGRTGDGPPMALSSAPPAASALPFVHIVQLGELRLGQDGCEFGTLTGAQHDHLCQVITLVVGEAAYRFAEIPKYGSSKISVR